ncbi:hypothetical protein IJ00_17420 [Calothrix sp. 336/3]|nr:hypothetical protein IJ00_17420 [Calothrix sp. 336/3]
MLVILLQVAQVVFDWLVKVFKELITWILSNSVTISAIIVSLLLFGTGCFLYFKRWKNIQYVGGNYNENIYGDCVEIHGHQININNDFTQLSKEICNLVEYLKSQGCKQEDAEEEIIKEIEEKTLKHPRREKILRRIRKSFNNKNNNSVSSQDVVKTTTSSYSYTNSKDFTNVIGGNLHILNELLQMKKWEEADKETAKIIRMIGQQNLPHDNYYKKNSPKYIVQDHIKVIPNNYLKDIDNCWIKYSYGQFGFSIQKDILQEILQDKKYTNSHYYLYSSQIIEKFGDLVGWRKEKDWLYYVDLYDSSKTAAKGHFPLAYMLRSGKLDKCRIDFDIFLTMIDRGTIF